MIYTMHERAKQFANILSKNKGLTVLNEVVFNQIIVCAENDEITDRLMKEVQRIGVCWVGGSVWKKRKVIRISICSWVTTKDDVEKSAKSFEHALIKIQTKKSTDKML